ncbi:MAG TPA: antibiotic biosynthesis monooxygenase, partial [Candidatus Paceibacterota bacterium]|nr:antibiotic biosynthesis monooxygenase [Candidatus Paceibacterota bacterium]
GSDSRDFGILRTFADEQERDAFYASPMFQAWEARARTLTEGEPEYRQLHGLEAWFRSPHLPPPHWKMACATFLGVFPLAMVLNLTVGSAIASWHFVLRNAVFNACVVLLLTWAVMPVVSRLLRPWLNPNPKEQVT